jgi:3-hydroxyacyl-CoA dehydrogenase/enoyl-CoA hydratase/3-hydroxybutyryl-CoA epimerase/3-hydroxyacyl-CoA dehydrogenase/enoyl-CoA hydratase/3-hydroxybutyryl-CoA epimerase/enoyl-CoA isomerase
MEAEAFARVLGSPVNRALTNVFFLQEWNKRDTGVEGRHVEPQRIRSVGVIGAGIMGRGIAVASMRRNLPVTITDVSSEALTAGVRRILEELSDEAWIDGPDAERPLRCTPLPDGTRADAELAECDVVIESVVENLDAKKELFARVEPQLDDRAVLASNTSTIPISKLAAGLARPARFCGIHFFNPVNKMPLVEVIRGAQTDDQTVAKAVAYAKALGKLPIVVGDGPGFLVNRLLSPYLNESLELVRSGADVAHVEGAAKGFGMPIGPLALFDVIGIDTVLRAGQVMYEAFPDRVIASNLLTAMYKAGRLGQKSGAGFFVYDGKDSVGRADPEVEKIIAKRRRAQRSFTHDELTMRLFLPMLVEATRVLEEQLIRNLRDIDLGLIFGLGFPPFRGGLLFWADTLGAARIVELLKPYQQLGKRYEPTEMLLEMARNGGTFYPRLGRSSGQT